MFLPDDDQLLPDFMENNPPPLDRATFLSRADNAAEEPTQEKIMPLASSSAKGDQSLPEALPLDKKVIPYRLAICRWPHDAETGEKLEWDTKTDGKKVITYSTLRGRWPYDAKTGQKLEWGTKIDGKNIVAHSALLSRWPYDATTGKKLPWGTAIDGKKVVYFTTIKKRWPHDVQTGKKLPWKTKIDDKTVVPYSRLIKYRPRDKKTGKVLDNGTPIGGDVVTSYTFNLDYTFVDANGNRYKGLDKKEAAFNRDPNLVLWTNREKNREKERRRQALLRQKKKQLLVSSEIHPSLDLNIGEPSLLLSQTPNTLGMHASEETELSLLAIPSSSSSSSAAYRAPISPGPEVIALFEQMTSVSTFTPAYQGTIEDNPHKRAKEQESSTAEPLLEPLAPLSPSFFQQG